jgi:hypothetical protein
MGEIGEAATGQVIDLVEATTGLADFTPRFRLAGRGSTFIFG